MNNKKNFEGKRKYFSNNFSKRSNGYRSKNSNQNKNNREPFNKNRFSKGTGSSNQEGGFKRQNFDSNSNRQGSGFNRQRSGSNRPRFNRSRNQPRRQQGLSFPVEKMINKRVEETEETIYKPMFRIEDLPIQDSLKKNIIKKGFKSLTPIQDQAIPAAVVGQDVVGIADTGSGKTAAFLIPAINKTIRNPKKKVLIVTPTRELALQINNEFRSLANNLRQYSIVCIGGTDIKNQIFFLRKEHHFIIGTPGRILDLIRTKKLNLNDVGTLVLDEVDRMLDMGFVDDVKEIIKNVPEFRQTLFFSATTSKQIDILMKKFLSVDYATFSVKKQDTSKNVDQDIVEVPFGHKKEEILSNLLQKDEVNKTIVFVRTKRFADKLAKYLQDNDIKVAILHGDKTLNQRKKSLDLFKRNVVSVLVATDVAARGLDIPDVSHVINYDVPENYEDYIHRIGRTGRANNTGYALTFVNSSDLNKIEKEKKSFQ